MKYGRHNKYPSLKILLTILDETNNKPGRKLVGSYVTEYNNYIKQIRHSNIDNNLKRYLFSLLREGFIKRFSDMAKLNEDEKNYLKSYVVARYRDCQREFEKEKK